MINTCLTYATCDRGGIGAGERRKDVGNEMNFKEMDSVKGGQRKVQVPKNGCTAVLEPYFVGVQESNVTIFC